jgi:hypothetical protein
MINLDISIESRIFAISSMSYIIHKYEFCLGGARWDIQQLTRLKNMNAY